MDAPAKARRIFKDLIGQPIVLFVIWGDDPAAEAIVAIASGLAGAEGDPRGVVWARRPSHLTQAVAQLSEAKPGFRTQIAKGTAAAFTLSSGGKIQDVIPSGEEADEVRIERAYERAEEG
jgi:hypothetical protein